MEPLINKAELQQILERGLVTGKWSVFQFNAPGLEPILPGKDFLEQHPQFSDMNFRDLEAFRKHHNNTWNGISSNPGRT